MINILININTLRIKGILALLLFTLISCKFHSATGNKSTGKECVTVMNEQIDVYLDTLTSLNAIIPKDTNSLYLLMLVGEASCKEFKMTITEVFKKSTIQCCVPRYNYYYKYKGRNFLIVNIKEGDMGSPNFIPLQSEDDKSYIFSKVFDDTETNKVNKNSYPSVRGRFTLTYSAKGGSKLYYQLQDVPKLYRIIDW